MSEKDENNAEEVKAEEKLIDIDTGEAETGAQTEQINTAPINREPAPAVTSSAGQTADESWYCSKCGEKNTAGRFCARCGSPKDTPPAAVPAKGKEKKERRIFTLPRVITCLIAVLLGLGAGCLGGWLVGKEVRAGIEEEIAAAIEEYFAFENDGSDYDFDFDDIFDIFGNIFGNDSNEGSAGQNGGTNDDTSEVPFIRAAIGISVSQDESVGYSGCTIASFTEGSKAQEAGLEIGDIVAAIDGVTMESYADIRAALSDKDPGEIISLTVIRNGKEVTVDVELVPSGTAN